MYKTLVFMLLTCALLGHSQENRNSSGTATANHQCRDAADDRGLRAIADIWRDGYNNGDHAKVAALYTEDAYYLTQHFATGIVHGRAMIEHM